MPRQTKFRPYAALPSEQQRLQRLRRFMEWLYREYNSPELFLSDFESILIHLDVGINFGLRSQWNRLPLLAYVQEQSIDWCQALHQQIREQVEKMIERGLGVTRDLPNYPRYIGHSTVITGPNKAEVFFDCGYRLGDTPQLETLRDLILLRLVDTLLYGLNESAIIPCQECSHYTVRSHARGKTFCSARCRVRASLRSRTLQLRKSAQTKSSRKRA